MIKFKNIKHVKRTKFTKRMKQLLRGITISLVFTLSYAHTATLEAKSYDSSTKQQTLSKKQLECLTLATYHESKGEGEKGMIAVINVTLNRVKDVRFPKTVCGVVYAKGQYSWSRNPPKIKEPEQYALAKQLAQEVVDGKHKDYSKGALYFNSINKKPTPTAKCTTKIGGHTFWK